MIINDFYTFMLNMFETWYKMASLIQSSLDLTLIITHHYKINDFQKGFEINKVQISDDVYSLFGWCTVDVSNI